VAEEGVASIAVLVDDTAFDGSWLYSAGNTLGGHVYFSYAGDATNANTTIRGSNFTNGIFTSSGGASGGACYFEFRGAVTKVHQQFEQCVFRNNTLIGSFVTGGGVAVYMRGESMEMAFTFLLCVFAHNVLRGNVSAYGAGVYMHFRGGTVRSVLLSVEHSAFESNVASASGAERSKRTASGAGLKMVVAAEATDMTTTIAHCTFRSNAVRAEGEGGDAGGAAVDLQWEGATAGGLLTTLLDSIFESNRGDGSAGSYGGAVVLNMYTTSSYTGAVLAVINRCRFLGNAVAGGNGEGGAIFHYTRQAGASLHALGCTIRGNTVSHYGAGIYAEQSNPNPPANLMMVATRMPPTYSVPYVCNPSFSAADGFARKYNCSSELVIDSCDISSNSAVSKDGAVKTEAAGGAVYAVTNTHMRRYRIQLGLIYTALRGVSVYCTIYVVG
jgi:hypothetical protein